MLVDVVPDPDPTHVRRFLTERGLIQSRRALVDDILEAAARLRGLLEAAGVPVVVVRATRSAIGQAEIERLAAAVPDLELVEIEAGHLVAHEAPNALAEVIGKAASRWHTDVRS